MSRDRDGEVPEDLGREDARGAVPPRPNAGVGRRVAARFGQGLRTTGQAVDRLWTGLTIGRARRAEARIEAAKIAARARAMEVAESVAPSPVPVKEKPAEVIKAAPEAVTPTEDILVEEEPEEPVEEEPEEPVEVETCPKVLPDQARTARARELAGRTLGGLGVAARQTRGILGRAGKALARMGAAIARGATATGRVLLAGLRSIGKALGPAGAAISTWGTAAWRALGVGLHRFARSIGPAWATVFAAGVAAGRAIGHAFRRAGKASAHVVGLALQRAGKALRKIGDVLGRWIRRIREAWATQPARPRMWISIGAGAAIMIAYILAQFSVASRVAPDTTMLGVGLGGMSSTEAREALEARLIEVSSAPISISAHGQVVEMSPKELGLSIDTEETFGSLTGFSLSPSALWRQVTGAGPAEPVVIVDEEVFKRAIDEVATGLNREARDAVVTLGPSGAIVEKNQDAVAVDEDALAQTVLAAWPSLVQIEAPAQITPPTLTTAEAERFARAVNTIALGSPVVLTSPNGSVTLTPEDVIAHGVIVTNGSHFNLSMDGEALEALVFERLPGVESPSVDAAFAFDSSHLLYVVPGTPARTLDTALLGDTATLAVTSASRTGVIPLIETPPATSTADLEGSDFKELVSTYHTEFIPREPSREHNIANAASRLSGTIVQPGEEFSITDAIGPIDGSHGYVIAGVIVGGVHTSGIGGGLCQIATTSYVAAYLAGYEIVERHEHSEWFSRYPAGRDAAIADGKDMRFRNDTPYALMFNAYVEDAGLTVDIWSTPYYTVEVSSSGKYNVTGGGYKMGTETPCYPSSPKSGFTITDTRTIYLDGELVKTESRVSHYGSVSGNKCS